MNIELLIAEQHERWLQWVEPWPAIDSKGERSPADVVKMATVHDCIKLERVMRRSLGRDIAASDYDLLLDFISVNWATEARSNPLHEKPEKQ